jgi:copper(I)-binding protein
MLMGRKHPLHAGDEVEITLSFSDGTQTTVTAEVRKAMEHAEHGGMDHSKHDMGH